MAKKGKKFMISNTVSSIIQMVVGVVIFLMLLLPNVVAKYEGSVTGKTLTDYNGFQAYFGAGYEDVSPSLGGILLVIFISLIVILPVLKLFLSPKVGMLLDFVILGLAVVCAVFFFLGTTTFMSVINNPKWSVSVGSVSSKNSTILGIGAIFGAVFSLVDAGYVIVNRFVLTK